MSLGDDVSTRRYGRHGRAQGHAWLLVVLVLLSSRTGAEPLVGTGSALVTLAQSSEGRILASATRQVQRVATARAATSTPGLRRSCGSKLLWGMGIGAGFAAVLVFSAETPTGYRAGAMASFGVLGALVASKWC